MNGNTVRFGNKIKTNLLCYARPDLESKTGFKLMLIEKDQRYYMESDDVCIATVPVEYFPPEEMNYEEFIKKAIESLRDKQKQVLATAELEVQRLEEKINNLMMLPHFKPDTAGTDIIDLNSKEILY